MFFGGWGEAVESFPPPFPARRTQAHLVHDFAALLSRQLVGSAFNHFQPHRVYVCVSRGREVEILIFALAHKNFLLCITPFPPAPPGPYMYCTKEDSSLYLNFSRVIIFVIID